MALLQDESAIRTFCLNRVELEASAEDYANGVYDPVKYEDCLRALLSGRVGEKLEFRNRLQTEDRLKSMLISLVSKGINKHLAAVAENHGPTILWHLRALEILTVGGFAGKKLMEAQQRKPRKSR